MFYGLINNIKETFKYSLHNTVGRPLFWLGLAIVLIVMDLANYATVYFKSIGLIYIAVILTIIQVVIDLFFLGIDVNILANRDLTFKGINKTLVFGIKALIVEIVYSAVIIGIYELMRFSGIFGAYGEVARSLYLQVVASSFSVDILNDIISIGYMDTITPLGVISFIVFVLFFFISIIIMLVAKVNFALSGKLKDGFNFPQMYARVKNVGILKFILGLVIYGILTILITLFINAVVALLGFIPDGIVLDITSILIVAPISAIFIIIFPTKYIATLFVK